MNINLNDLTTSLDHALNMGGESRKANASASLAFVTACQSGNAGMALSVLMLARPERGTDKDASLDFNLVANALKKALRKAGFILSVKGDGSIEPYTAPATASATASATTTVGEYPETSLATMLQHRHILLATNGTLPIGQSMGTLWFPTKLVISQADEIATLKRQLARALYDAVNANGERDNAIVNLDSAVAMLARVQGERDSALALVASMKATRETDKRPMVKRMIKVS